MMWRQNEFPVLCIAQKANINSGCVKRGKDKTGCATVNIVLPAHEQDRSGNPGDQGKAPVIRNLENSEISLPFIYPGQ